MADEGRMDVKSKLAEYPLLDCAILGHGFASYMRDYVLTVEQTVWSRHRAGRYLFTFSHCPVANVRSTVSDEVWKKSWDDVFTNFGRWKREGEPEGFVWGVCWSLAYPGLEYVSTSELARTWSHRLGRPMHEVTIETEAFHLQLVFHDVDVEQLDDTVEVVDKVIVPLPPR